MLETLCICRRGEPLPVGSWTLLSRNCFVPFSEGHLAGKLSSCLDVIFKACKFQLPE